MKVKVEVNSHGKGNIEIDKFFRFLTLGEDNGSGLREVNVFIAAVFKCEKPDQTPGLNCSISVESDRKTETDFEFSDKSEYFNEISIIRQFWGAVVFLLVILTVLSVAVRIVLKI
ncbi:MAG: hypothetical protein OIF57_03345 [Marinobacterium sp.]|nr:hypothetical protein [Marinobacterium sp.]